MKRSSFQTPNSKGRRRRRPRPTLRPRLSAPDHAVSRPRCSRGCSAAPSWSSAELHCLRAAPARTPTLRRSRQRRQAPFRWSTTRWRRSTTTTSTTTRRRRRTLRSTPTSYSARASTRASKWTSRKRTSALLPRRISTSNCRSNRRHLPAAIRTSSRRRT